jgi:SAM-dependent methyltransferase
MHVDQANLVFRTKGVAPDRYRFVQGDIFSYDFASEGPFDLVLCLGLLYHVSKTVELFEKISAANSDLLLIETKVSLLPGAVLEIYREDLDDTRNAIDHELVLVPSRRAVSELAREFGYDTIVLPVDTITDFVGMHDYRDGKRAAFICAKKTVLSSLEPGVLDLAFHPLQLTLDRHLNGLDVRLHRRRAERTSYSSAKR